MILQNAETPGLHTRGIDLETQNTVDHRTEYIKPGDPVHHILIIAGGCINLRQMGQDLILFIVHGKRIIGMTQQEKCIAIHRNVVHILPLVRVRVQGIRYLLLFPISIERKRL